MVTNGELTDLARRLSDEIDLFICSASFENRCLSIASNVDRARMGQVVIFQDRRFTGAVEGNLNKLQELFGGRETTIVVDSGDPVGTTENILAAMWRCREADVRRIVVDITTFTHETLLILFRVCDMVFDRRSVVDFVYATASEYSVGDAEGEKWLSKGISEVRSVMGYPGGFMPSRGTHLVVLAGFEDYRVLNLVREVEPAVVSLGRGDRSERATAPHQSINERNVARVRELIGNAVGDVREFVFSCYNGAAAARTIEKIVTATSEYNTIVAPMNTKISTLGAGSVARRNDAVQLCYAQAEIYNFRKYSRPGVEFYWERFHRYPSGGEVVSK